MNWAASIGEVVKQKGMPPWLADPAHGKFAKDRSLSSEDRETLLSWIDQGCPKGDLKDLPAQREFSKGWISGKPDVVVTMPEEFKVPAKAGAKGIDYHIFAVPTNFHQAPCIHAPEANPRPPQAA